MRLAEQSAVSQRSILEALSARRGPSEPLPVKSEEALPLEAEHHGAQHLRPGVDDREQDLPAAADDHVRAAPLDV